MSLHQLVTVKKAAIALGVDKDVIRNMIDIGAIRGERRVNRNKEKWFIYDNEFQLLLEEQRLTRKSDRVDLEGLTDFFTPADAANNDVSGETLPEPQAELSPVIEADFGQEPAELKIAEEDFEHELNEVEPPSDNSDERSTLILEEPISVTEVDEQAADHPDRLYLAPDQLSIERMLESLTIEFAHRLTDEKQKVCNLQRQLDEKIEVLNSLPDLQQKMEEIKSEVESKDAEIASLKANLATLQTDLAWWKKPWWNRLFAPAKS